LSGVDVGKGHKKLQPIVSGDIRSGDFGLRERVSPANAGKAAHGVRISGFCKANVLVSNDSMSTRAFVLCQSLKEQSYGFVENE
jgi:hypothetical protein